MLLVKLNNSDGSRAPLLSAFGVYYLGFSIMIKFWTMENLRYGPTLLYSPHLLHFLIPRKAWLQLKTGDCSVRYYLGRLPTSVSGNDLPFRFLSEKTGVGTHAIKKR